jgi:hypothetical protein
MAGKILICISAARVTVARWRHGQLAACHAFAHDNDGTAAFRALLAEWHPAPTYVIVDAVEEDYRMEVLPHARGRDRKALIARKLRQVFRNASYSAAVLQGRERDKRRDDRYLFCALTNPDLAERWLKILTDLRLPLAGFHLLPMVTERLLPRVKLAGDNLLVVAPRDGGLRLTFFDHGRLRLSRLTRSDARGGGGRVAAFAEDVRNTRLYLHAVHVANMDEHSTVAVIDPDGSLTDLAAALAPDQSNLTVLRFDAPALATRLGLPIALLRGVPDALYLQLLGERVPAANLAPRPLVTRHRMFLLRRTIYAAAAVLAVAALGWSGVNLYGVYNANADAAHATLQTRVEHNHYEAIRRQFPAAPTSPENLRDAVETAQRIVHAGRTPQAIMAVVGHALDATPQIRLNGLDWQYGTDQKQSADRRPATATTTATGHQQQALIKAEVRSFDGDYRKAIDAINRFAAHLRDEPTVAEARVTKLPLNLDPQQSLSGNMQEERGRPARAEFEVQITLKAGT